MKPVAEAIDALAVQRLDRRRVYIFPTAPGFTLGAMLIIILLGAINYDNALGYLLTFLLGGLVLVAMLHSYRNLAGLRFTGARATAVFVGDGAEFECHLENDAGQPRLRLALCRWPVGLSRDARRYHEQFETVCDLAAVAHAAPLLRVEALRRGWLRCERVRVQSVYPLGILRTWAYFDSDAACLVYPVPRGTLPLPYLHAASPGSAAWLATGTDDFAGLRPYTPGDPVRAIAWKTLAKEQDLMVKRFHGNTTARVWLSWDAVAMLGGTEARLSQLCKWTVEASRAGSAFGLELPGKRIEFGHGPQHREQCLRALALFEATA